MTSMLIDHSMLEGRMSSHSYKAWQLLTKANYHKVKTPCCGNCVHSWTELDGCFECKKYLAPVSHHGVCDKYVPFLGGSDGTNS